jgi:hypothetical protein
VSKAAGYVRKANQKRVAAGWVKKGIWLSPLAAMDLERECAKHGLRPGALIAMMLEKERPH